MPQAARINDLCTGHSCYPPRPNDQGSLNVFVNSRAAHRRGDHWADHCCGDACHDSNTIEGSPTVFVNGIPLARVADAVECGSVIMTGSHNVFANG